MNLERKAGSADAFSSLHPILCFAWFASVTLVTVLFMHPWILAISMVSGGIYALYLGNRKSNKLLAIFLLPTMLVAGLINPLFNHRGMTTLFYFRGNPITLESIFYGGAAAVMIGAVLLWFSCYNAVMTSDKFLYIFGKIIPALSLVISMALRFIPRYAIQIRRIIAAQRGIGMDVSSGGLLTRARSGVHILSIMTTWALENAVETADSMRSRGYGMRGRTAYSNYRFDQRDGWSAILMMALFPPFLIAIFFNILHCMYFPLLTINETEPGSLIFYGAWMLYCLLPMIMNIREDMIWRSSRSKI